MQKEVGLIYSRWVASVLSVFLQGHQCFCYFNRGNGTNSTLSTDCMEIHQQPRRPFGEIQFLHLLACLVPYCSTMLATRHACLALRCSEVLELFEPRYYFPVCLAWSCSREAALSVSGRRWETRPFCASPSLQEDVGRLPPSNHLTPAAGANPDPGPSQSWCQR